MPKKLGVASQFEVVSSAAEVWCKLDLVISRGFLSVLQFREHANDKIVGR